MNTSTMLIVAAFDSLRARLDSRDKGATMVEYGLLVSLIAVVAIAALLVLGPAIAALFEDVAGEL